MRSSRATVGTCRSPSTSGRATEASPASRRWSQSEESRGVRNGTSIRSGCLPRSRAVRSIIVRYVITSGPPRSKVSPNVVLATADARRARRRRRRARPAASRPRPSAGRSSPAAARRARGSSRTPRCRRRRSSPRRASSPALRRRRGSLRRLGPAAQVRGELRLGPLRGRRGRPPAARRRVRRRAATAVAAARSSSSKSGAAERVDEVVRRPSTPSSARATRPHRRRSAAIRCDRASSAAACARGSATTSCRGRERIHEWTPIVPVAPTTATRISVRLARDAGEEAPADDVVEPRLDPPERPAQQRREALHRDRRSARRRRASGSRRSGAVRTVPPTIARRPSPSGPKRSSDRPDPSTRTAPREKRASPSVERRARQ